MACPVHKDRVWLMCSTSRCQAKCLSGEGTTILTVRCFGDSRIGREGSTWPDLHGTPLQRAALERHEGPRREPRALPRRAAPKQLPGAALHLAERLPRSEPLSNEQCPEQRPRIGQGVLVPRSVLPRRLRLSAVRRGDKPGCSRPRRRVGRAASALS